jgi:hypothetical protein
VRRDGFTLDQGLALWTYYNSQIVRRFGKFNAAHWIDFDGGIEHVVQRVADIAAAAGLQVNAQVAASYAGELRTSDASGDAACACGASQTLYEQLREKCYT